VNYENLSSYSEIHQKRKEMSQFQKRRHSIANPSISSHKSQTTKSRRKAHKGHKKRSEVSFNAYNNPNNHMSGANWVFDHKKSPWDQLMNRTMDMQDLNKSGHYRKPSQIRAKQEKQRQIDLIDVVIDQLPVRTSTTSTRKSKIREKQRRLKDVGREDGQVSEKGIQMDRVSVSELLGKGVKE
jgi:hypothetical protein